MTVAYSDRHPTLYVVHGRANPVLRGPNSTKPNLFHHGETTNRLGWLSEYECCCHASEKGCLPERRGDDCHAGGDGARREDVHVDAALRVVLWKRTWGEMENWQNFTENVSQFSILLPKSKEYMSLVWSSLTFLALKWPFRAIYRSSIQGRFIELGSVLRVRRKYTFSFLSIDCKFSLLPISFATSWQFGWAIMD